MVGCEGRGWRSNDSGDVTRFRARGGTTLFRKEIRARGPLGALLIGLLALLILGTGCSATGRFFGTTTWAKPLQIDETTVVLGTKSGEVVAVSIADGSELWNEPFATEEGRNSVTAVFGSPITDGTFVYAGGFGGSLYAIRLNTDLGSGTVAGQEAWRFVGDSAFVGGPALAGDLIVIGSEDGTLYGVEPPTGPGVTGTARWSFSTEGDIWSTPAIVDGLAIVGTLDGVLHAVYTEDDPATGGRAGEEKWQVTTGAGIGVRPIIDGDTVYFGSFDTKVYAVDVDDGSPRWLEPFETGNWIWAELLLHEGRLYVPSLDHNLYVLDASSGTEFRDRRVETGGAIRGAPALVAENFILIANEEEETWWIDIATGTPRAGIALTSPAYAPVLSTGANALIFAQNGRLYRVAPAARQPVQIYPVSG